MPRKSHRRRRRKMADKLQTPAGYNHLRALEKQEELRQESNRQHINKALEGRRAPGKEIIVENLRRKYGYTKRTRT